MSGRQKLSSGEDGREETAGGEGGGRWSFEKLISSTTIVLTRVPVYNT